MSLEETLLQNAREAEQMQRELTEQQNIENSVTAAAVQGNEETFNFTTDVHYDNDTENSISKVENNDSSTTADNIDHESTDTNEQIEIPDQSLNGEYDESVTDAFEKMAVHLEAEPGDYEGAGEILALSIDNADISPMEFLEQFNDLYTDVSNAAEMGNIEEYAVDNLEVGEPIVTVATEDGNQVFSFDGTNIVTGEEYTPNDIDSVINDIDNTTSDFVDKFDNDVNDISNDFNNDIDTNTNNDLENNIDTGIDSAPQNDIDVNADAPNATDMDTADTDSINHLENTNDTDVYSSPDDESAMQNMMDSQPDNSFDNEFKDDNDLFNYNADSNSDNLDFDYNDIDYGNNMEYSQNYSQDGGD